MPKPRIKVVCLECGKKWSTTNDGPECPKCGGTDIDVRDDVLLELAASLNAPAPPVAEVPFALTSPVGKARGKQDGLF